MDSIEELAVLSSTPPPPSTSNNGSNAGTSSIVVEHIGIACDICHQSPIEGTRYLSKCLINYDLCETCFYNHESVIANDYVPLRMPPYYSMEELVQALQQQNSDTNNNEHFATAAAASSENKVVLEEAYLRLYESVELEQYEAFQMALANCTTIKSLWLYMYDDDIDSTSSVICVARGMMENKSIQQMGWAIPNDCRMNTTNNTTTVKIALREMIEKNHILEELYLWTPRMKETIHPAEDDFTRSIIDGLRINHTLQVMRLESFHIISHSIRNHVIHILQEYNKTLKYLFVRFEKDDHYQLGLLFGNDDENNHGTIHILDDDNYDDDDNRVEMLLARNRGQWLSRLTNDKASSLDRQTLFVEALDNVPMNASVMTMHYLLQNYPMLLNDLQSIILS